jgi:hypothetical protein
MPFSGKEIGPDKVELIKYQKVRGEVYLSSAYSLAK